MRIKTKIAWAVGGLFTALVAIGGLGWFYLNELSADARNILKDNYLTLQYTKQIIEGLDSLHADSAAAMALIESNLQLQEENITEPTERQLTALLRSAFEKLKHEDASSDRTETLMRKYCLQIQDINMSAIIAKNELTQATAGRATTYLMVTFTIVSLVAFSFIVNFPGYVANPIARLTESIKSIAGRNYEARLTFNRNDEFEELASAFNQMAERLDEYEHSNLEKILSEKKRVETIINRMSDPVIGLDERSRVVFVNDQALTLLNLTRDRIIDRYAPDVAVENDLFRTLIKPLANNADAATPLIKIALHGKENYFSKESVTISYKPTGGQEPVFVGQVILMKNITPYKELDLAKTNFIATISHELKTPIASLQMCVKLLKDARVGALNQEQESIVHTLNDETVRLSRITTELLDLAQVETGNIKLSIQSTSAHDIIDYALEAVKFHAQRKNVHIDMTMDDNVPPVQADHEKTTWVLVNILTNAIRYSPENGNVELTCTHTGNGKVRIAVKDYGPGIESKYIPRLFEKFFKVPGTASGTGLGLAISKEFIDAQSGRIFVNSEFGKGSVFGFELPAVAAQG